MLLWGSNRRTASAGDPFFPISPPKRLNLPGSLWKINLFGPRRRDGLPIQRTIHHFAHPLEPPVRPAQPALTPIHRRACTRFTKTEFHLLICHSIHLSFETILPQGVGQKRSKEKESNEWGIGNFSGFVTLNADVQSCRSEE